MYLFQENYNLYKIRSDCFFKMIDCNDKIISFYQKPLLNRFLISYDYLENLKIEKFKLKSQIEILDYLIKIIETEKGDK